MMNRGAVVVENAELIKWFGVLDMLIVFRHGDVDRLLRMASECQHPDAQWLAALFAPGATVTSERMREVMLQQGDDPRALYFAFRLGGWNAGLLRRAADKGFARAQAEVARRSEDDSERLQLLEKA
jgi:hypothetical protein